MLVTATITLLVVFGALAFVARHLSKAPEGYEGDHGFYVIHRGWGVPSAQVRKAKKPGSSSGVGRPATRHA